jgi:omega-amidase
MSSLTITIIQTNLSWENKKANLTMLQQKIEAINEKTEVVVLPEMFTTGFSMQPEKLAEDMNGETMRWMKKISSKKKIILTGSLIIQEDDKYFNRLIWMLPDGNYGYYDKRHLFAYGNEHLHYTPGNRRLIASVKGWKINLQVCYDLRFPVWARQSQGPSADPLTRKPEYDVLIYVANWPETRILAWKTLLQARAIENQCYTIGVNRVGNDGNNIYYSGDSMIVNPSGEILFHKKDEEAVETFSIDKNVLGQAWEKFPFWRDADSFIINN